MADAGDSKSPGLTPVWVRLPPPALFEDYAFVPLDVPPPPIVAARLAAFVELHCESAYFTENVARFILFHARKPIAGGALVLHSCDPRLTETGGHVLGPSHSIFVPAAVAAERDPAFDARIASWD